MGLAQRGSVRGASLACFAAALVLAACGGKQRGESTPSAAGASGNGTAGAVSSAGTAGAAGAVAQNGVPIPELLPGPLDTCAGLGIVLRSCSAEPCKDIWCECADTLRPQLFGASCVNDTCIAAVSCPAVCPLEEPKGSVYQCSNYSWCQTDADCVDGSCMVGQYASGTCSFGTPGAPCNLDKHCKAPMRCILPADYFVGECRDGEGASCQTNDDCPTPQRCVDFGKRRNICTSQQLGSPCTAPSHCVSGYCGNGQCTSGALGDACDAPEDCEQPFCTDGHCTSGGNGAACRPTEKDCASGFNCVGRSTGTYECSDGALGAACSYDEGPALGCQGLLCTPGPDGGRCLGPRPVGEGCLTDEHCLSGVCAGGDERPPALCTEGKLGQHCVPGQCVSGLFCASNSTDGICVAGVPGDPCTEDAGCKSGMCGAPVMLDGSAQMQCAKLNGTGPCGNGGACIFWTCSARRCQ